MTGMFRLINIIISIVYYSQPVLSQVVLEGNCTICILLCALCTPFAPFYHLDPSMCHLHPICTLLCAICTLLCTICTLLCAICTLVYALCTPFAPFYVPFAPFYVPFAPFYMPFAEDVVHMSLHITCNLVNITAYITC